LAIFDNFLENILEREYYVANSLIFQK